MKIFLFLLLAHVSSFIVPNKMFPMSRHQMVQTTERSSESLNEVLDGGDSPKRISTKEPSFNKSLVDILKGMLDLYYGDRDFARFYALETIARVPYFSYLSVLHLYETLGWWRKANYLKIHFAESWNELHHLLIMEELGGNKNFGDRWLAQHAAFFYYWIVCTIYALSPQNAYNLNQHVEEHAFSTYDKFLKEKEVELKAQEAPPTAIKYYSEDKLYVFNNLHNSDMTFEEIDKKRPTINSLYDVFVCIRNDEGEHAKTMEAMQVEDF
eukprot:CAMPEP_0171463072 /NCGR_PEP_ID=MMETSP0945-20130129/6867_1 /TAXON_ID=109269 /ORGANISM="Vaucheria litorea, Strain CCMP2940" /LENGTH=267 /DNA_ID=CAMNT_0011989747 /DNA_START=32 /DNA_END=835 /DNA_ORIENTATION=+